MGASVERILREPTRRWIRQPGASAEEIDRLLAATPCPLPQALVDLLRLSNGGEGDLALPPRFFMLDSVSEIIEGFRDAFLNEEFPGFLFFGGNGGIERIALDVRAGTPVFPVVMIDPIAGSDSAEEIAPDFSTFVTAIGLEYRDNESH
jgi:SMI1/KNR4 family protein SUKH-1